MQVEVEKMFGVMDRRPVIGTGGLWLQVLIISNYQMVQTQTGTDSLLVMASQDILYQMIE